MVYRRTFSLMGFYNRCCRTDFYNQILEKEKEKCFLTSSIKKTSANEQFGASGGAASYDTEQVTASFALVRALPMPPPA